MEAHLPTLLVAVCLALSGADASAPPLPPPVDRPNLLRLRDVLEEASILPDVPLTLTTRDHEALLICLLTTEKWLEQGGRAEGPPDLLLGLEEERRAAAYRAVSAQVSPWVLRQLLTPRSGAIP